MKQQKEKQSKPLPWWGCGCVVPIVLVFVLAMIGAAIAGAINNVQIGACSVPSELFINTAACEAYARSLRPLAMIGGAVFGGILGAMLGFVVFLLSPKAPKKSGDTFGTA